MDYSLICQIADKDEHEIRAALERLAVIANKWYRRPPMHQLKNQNNRILWTLSFDFIVFFHLP